LRRFLAFLLFIFLSVDRPLWAATAARGMVAAEHELAAQAGVDMFRQGGNAVDAAVAAVFAIGVVNPTSCGIGGGGFALIHDGKTHALHVVDFRETAPAAASPNMYVRDGKVDPRLSLRGGLAVGVPGEVRGLTQLLRDFGTLPLSVVLAPAVRYAAEGFPVGSHLAEVLHADADDIRRWPDLAAVYLKPNGEPYAGGEILVQRDLASTLRAIATGGEETFYGGEIARRIAAAVAEQHGLLTVADLSGYRTRARVPLVMKYRDITLATAPPPTGGGIVLEILKVLEGYDLGVAGPRSISTLHRVAQAEAFAFRDRARYYGDPAFTDVPVSQLLSAAHAAHIRGEIARKTQPNGTVASEKGGTAHTSVIDDRGNAVAVTSTINTAFGSMVLVPGTGIVLNNEMDDFSAAPGVANVYGLVGNRANSIQPGKRPLSSISPVLALRARAPVLAVGGSGGPRIITATVQTLLNVIDFGMPLEAAVAAPRIHDQAVPDRLFYEPELDPAVAAGLRRLGHKLVEAHGLGAVQAVQVLDHHLVGVSDPRKGGAAEGW
jgi:gamma-glutamyltranspeptidase / glutathione hydrolase